MRFSKLSFAVGLTTLLVGGGQTLQGVLAASTGVEACYKECSDDKSMCESPCLAKATTKTTEPATCLTECKHSFKGCMQACDEAFPDSSASKANVSLEPEYAPRQYLGRLGSRVSSGLKVSGITVGRFESSSGTKLELGSGSQNSVLEDAVVEQIHGSGRGLQTTGNLTVLVKHDNYQEETSWQFIKGMKTLIGYQTQGSILTPYMQVVKHFSVTAGNYTFVIRDSMGDGICCRYGEGYYALYLDGKLFKHSYFMGPTYGEFFTISLS
jgi:hypothetical protein